MRRSSFRGFGVEVSTSVKRALKVRVRVRSATLNMNSPNAPSPSCQPQVFLSENFVAEMLDELGHGQCDRLGTAAIGFRGLDREGFGGKRGRCAVGIKGGDVLDLPAVALAIEGDE